MLKIIIFVLILIIFGCSKNQDPNQTKPAKTTDQIQTSDDKSEYLVVSPDDMNRPIISAIDSAKSKIILANFHLSNHDIVNALVDSAKRNVKIRIILDKSTLAKTVSAQKTADYLKSNSIEVKPSTSAFSITHEKTFVIDDRLALVSTINLVTTFAVTRDFGLFTHDKDIINEINSVFEADWENADNNGNVTPDLHNSRLLWSPINSLDKIKVLIGSAKKNIKLMVENLGEQEIHDALISKAKEGVSIQVMTPGCVIGDGLHNRLFIKELQENNILNKVSTAKSDSEHPYIHAKMILVDNDTFYIGSENFSYNSLLKARELGIITTATAKAQKLSDIFDHDWNNGVSPDSIATEDCDKVKN